MERTRVYELARALGIGNSAALGALISLGAPVRNRFSAVDSKWVAKVRVHLEAPEAGNDRSMYPLSKQAAKCILRDLEHELCDALCKADTEELRWSLGTALRYFDAEDYRAAASALAELRNGPPNPSVRFCYYAVKLLLSTRPQVQAGSETLASTARTTSTEHGYGEEELVGSETAGRPRTTPLRGESGARTPLTEASRTRRDVNRETQAASESRAPSPRKRKRDRTRSKSVVTKLREGDLDAYVDLSDTVRNFLTEWGEALHATLDCDTLSWITKVESACDVIRERDAEIEERESASRGSSGKWQLRDGYHILGSPRGKQANRPIDVMPDGYYGSENVDSSPYRPSYTTTQKSLS